MVSVALLVVAAVLRRLAGTPIAPVRTVDADELVRALCTWLDDRPLAVELAAARTPALSPAKILERLERRLPALACGGADAPARQRTLEGTIWWSYDLCTDEERALFARLAVFVDGCTLEPPSRSAIQTSTCSPRSWSSSWCACGTIAAGCSKRSTSSRRRAPTTIPM